MKHIITILFIFFSVIAFSQVTVQLNGKGTDSDGTVAAFLWKQIGGTSVSISNPNIANPSIVFTVPGIYKFRLTGTDNQGKQSVLGATKDSVMITIVAANLPPRVDAGPDQIIQLPSVTTIDKALRDKQNYYVWVRKDSVHGS